ncbi:MAG: MFS transporter [Nocardioides sp.]
MSGFSATAARNATALAFFLNGFAFASWVSRIPQVREDLSLSNGELGTLLLALALGSLLALPTTGALISRFGTARVVVAGAVAVTIAMMLLATGGSLLTSVVVTSLGAFLYGAGTASWDVAMNVEGVAVEQELDRAIMPRFHAAFSLGTVAGGGIGAGLVALDVPMILHLGGVVLVGLALILWGVRSFIPGHTDAEEEASGPSVWTAWREPRTLVIGLMVLAFALTEGAANDWLALALVDGHDVSKAVGVLGYAAFVTAMTLGRLVGTSALNAYGRVRVLLVTAVSAIAGLMLIVFGTGPVFVIAGILLWGLGASLGFPVGMSAAADDPKRSAARVSVVSTIGYGAFLAGPPVVGYIADHTGTLKALLFVAIFLVPSTLAIFAAREPQRG